MTEGERNDLRVTGINDVEFLFRIAAYGDKDAGLGFTNQAGARLGRIAREYRAMREQMEGEG